MPFAYDRWKNSKLLGRGVVIWALLILGPLGLPLLWLSPRFRILAKLLITFFLIVASILLVHYTTVLLNDLNQRFADLKELTGT
jgi:hypothetical protein